MNVSRSVESALLVALTSTCATVSTNDRLAADERPNVILIVTDDQGYGDFGFMGNPIIQTPHLDGMAERSARMGTFYVSPVCAPTRAALMTGRYCQRTRAIDTYIGRAMMEPDEVTIAEALGDAGWATGIFGKWHLGDCYPMRPLDQGFDEAFVHRGGGIGQPSDPEGGERKYTDAVLFRNGGRVQTEGYCTDVYFDAAMDWIGEQHAAGQPFFAYVATNAPHGPFHDVPEELYEQYRAADLSQSIFADVPGHALPAEQDDDRLARIFAMITNIDENVGRLFAELERLGATEDTLVLFHLDNGPNTRRYVAGMRGRKGEVYEGGVRSPLLAHWPGRLEPGECSDRISAHIDVMPTILEACGVDAPDGVRLDGRSLLPLLERRDVDWPDRALTVQAHRGDEAVRYHHFFTRTQGWKLVNASGFHKELERVEPAFELYDMIADPLEEHDLATERPDVLRELVARYDSWFDDVSSTRPDNYAPPRIHLGSDAEPKTVLTRQDWRKSTKDNGWNAHSHGHWEVFVERSGVYRIRATFLKNKDVDSATLWFGESSWSVTVPEGARECVFEGVELPTGEGRLRVDATTGDEVAGAYQVFVTLTAD